MNHQYRRFWPQIFGLFPDLKQWQTFFNQIEQQVISASSKMEGEIPLESWNNLKVDVDSLLDKNYAPDDQLLSLEFPLKTMKQLLDIMIYCFHLFVDLLKFRLFHHQVSTSDIVNLHDFFAEHPEQQSEVKNLLEKSYPDILDSITVYIKLYENDCSDIEKDDHRLLVVSQTILDKLKTQVLFYTTFLYGLMKSKADTPTLHSEPNSNLQDPIKIEKRKADCLKDDGCDSTESGGNSSQSNNAKSKKSRKCSNGKGRAKPYQRVLRSSSNSKVKSSSTSKSPKSESKKTPKKNSVQRKALKTNKFQCTNCGKSFDTVEKLCNHIKKTYLTNNTGVASKKCLICSKSLSGRNNIVGHMLGVHDLVPDIVLSGMVYECRCGFLAKNDDGHKLYEHFVQKHRSDSKCVNCAKNYHIKQRLLRHVVQSNCCLNMVKSKFSKCPFKCCAEKDNMDLMNPYQMKLHIFRSHIADF